MRECLITHGLAETLFEVWSFFLMVMLHISSSMTLPIVEVIPTIIIRHVCEKMTRAVHMDNNFTPSQLFLVI